MPRNAGRDADAARAEAALKRRMKAAAVRIAASRHTQREQVQRKRERRSRLLSARDKR